MLPATVPHMFTGLRIGVGMSWLAIVAAEMVQGGTGVGFFIWDSYNSRSEEHTSELQSLMRISYAVFCLKTNNLPPTPPRPPPHCIPSNHLLHTRPNSTDHIPSPT